MYNLQSYGTISFIGLGKEQWPSTTIKETDRIEKKKTGDEST